MMNGNGNGHATSSASPGDREQAEQFGRYLGLLLLLAFLLRSISLAGQSTIEKETLPLRPPFNAEFLLYLLLPREEMEVVSGDLIEGYGTVRERFDKRRADIWFCKQVVGSLLPLVRRALLRIGALVWLGRILRRLVS
jgi:hypothetical protein